MKLNKKTLSNITLALSVATLAVQVVKFIKKKKEMKKEEKRYTIQEDDFVDINFEALYPQQLEAYMAEEEYVTFNKYDVSYYYGAIS